MSALGGLCFWDREPVPNERLSELSTYLKVAGPDAGGTVHAMPWLALQAHILHFDRLSKGERQPYLFASGSVLTWDGRLDNRDDLLLLLHRDLHGDESDAAIVAAAYDRWGVEAFPRFVGDWCLAIWDAQEHRVVLARDFMGTRALYYRVEPNRLAWASRLDALAACEKRFGEPNDEYIAGFLTKAENPPDATPFNGISMLLGGHVLIGTRDGATIRRYWKYSPATLRYHSVDQYADQLRVLLTDAVRVRLRSTRTVWAHLSGGWDSSSIVCLAHRLLQRRSVEAPAIQPLSVVYDDAEAADERMYMAAVESWCGLATRTLTFRGRPTFAELLGSRVPVNANEAFGMEAPVQQAGDRIILTGSMGDMLMGRHGGTLSVLLESFYSGHPVVALRNLITYAHATKTPVARLLLKAIRQRKAPAERTPRASEVLARNWSNRRPERGYEGVPPDLLARALVRPRVATPSTADFPRTIQHLVEGFYRSGDLGVATPEWLIPVVWNTHPFLHRPLLEFLVAVPSEALFDPVFARAGMRRALIDVLPPAILNRVTKVGMHATPHARVRDKEAELLRDSPPLTEDITHWRVVQRGVVNHKTLLDDAQAVRAGKRPSKFLYRCLRIEAWLRSISTPTTELAPITVNTTVVRGGSASTTGSIRWQAATADRETA